MEGFMSHMLKQALKEKLSELENRSDQRATLPERTDELKIGDEVGIKYEGGQTYGVILGGVSVFGMDCCQLQTEKNSITIPLHKIHAIFKETDNE